MLELPNVTFATRVFRPDEPRARGFSLMELLVVIVVIGVMAVLAIPAMSLARLDRRAYDDAGAVMQLLRSARTRAIARGGAVLVRMTSNGPTDRGTFYMFEAVTNNAAGLGLARTPVASCKSPTDWSNPPLPGSQPNPNVLLVDGVTMNNRLEIEADIQTQISIYASPTDTAPTPVQSLNVCWTPLGRSYVSAIATPTVGMFDGQQPTLTPLQIDVTRATLAGGAGTIRSVLVPPNGMARLFSHAVVAQP